MRYALNVETIDGLNSYRLNKSNDWRCCTETSILKTTDYFTESINEINKLQVLQIQRKIEGQIRTIEPEEIIYADYENQLQYEIYGFRKTYPNPPDEKQLTDLLLSGDDSVVNNIVLKTDGLFYLFKKHQLLEYGSNPEIVFQFEGLKENKGYVGNGILSRKKNYVQELFRVSTYYWLNHLKFKKLYTFAEISLNEIQEIPGMQNILDELNHIQATWKPDY